MFSQLFLAAAVATMAKAATHQPTLGGHGKFGVTAPFYFRSTEDELCQLLSSDYLAFEHRVKQLADGPEDPRWPYVLNCDNVNPANLRKFVRNVYKDLKWHLEDDEEYSERRKHHHFTPAQAERIPNIVFPSAELFLKAKISQDDIAHFAELARPEFKVGKYHALQTLHEMEDRGVPSYISYLPTQAFYAVLREFLLRGVIIGYSGWYSSVISNSPEYHQVALRRYDRFNYDDAVKRIHSFGSDLKIAQETKNADKIIEDYSITSILGYRNKLNESRFVLEPVDIVYYLFKDFDANLPLIIKHGKKFGYIGKERFKGDLESIVGKILVGDQLVNALEIIEHGFKTQ